MADRISHDFDLDWDDIVAQTADGATVGRPHIADALIARGHVHDRAEAFSGILSPRGSYYIALFAPDPVTAVGSSPRRAAWRSSPTPRVAQDCCRSH